MTAFPRISIRRSAARGLLVTALALVAGGIPSARSVSAQNQDPPPADASPSDPAQPDPAQSRPTFRVEAGFVRVDAYATLNGVAVRDLTADEFEVYEDGVPQKIETFEHVDVRGGAGPQEMVREPNSVREGVAEASDPRNRVFVIFLDKYFVDTEGSFRMKRSLVTMLERIIGPDDLFAVMTPEMSAKDIALARRTTTIENELTRHWAWGERGRMGVYEKLEAQLDLCYGAAAGPIIARLREKRTLDALTDLARYLHGIREERKAVIPITAGWLLYREDPRLTNTERPADPGRIGIGPDGRLTTDVRAADNLNLSRHQCDSLRQQLAFTDNWQSFHDLLGLANRANVSFYPVDPRGLAAIDSPAGFSIRPPHVETRLIRERVDNLLTLAEQTDGMAVVDTNALDRGMARIVDDLTSYYLLGYYTSNPKLDGKFRKIEVRAKRRGVEVRHRRGYRAATEEDIERARELTAEAAVETPPSAVASAINSLGAARAGVPLRTRVSYTPLGASNGSSRARVWALAELDAAIARGEDWTMGGEAEVQVAAADGTPLASTKVPVPPRARSVIAEIPNVELSGEEVVVRFQLRPGGGGLPLTDTVRLMVPGVDAPGTPVLLRRGPTTGLEYVPTADQRFQRTERLRLELPILGAAGDPSAEVLDRNGKALTVPVKTATRADGAVTWATAEVSLAPLAPGDYAIRLSATRDGKRQEVVTGFRLVP